MMSNGAWAMGPRRWGRASRPPSSWSSAPEVLVPLPHGLSGRLERPHGVDHAGVLGRGQDQVGQALVEHEHVAERWQLRQRLELGREPGQVLAQYPVRRVVQVLVVLLGLHVLGFHELERLVVGQVDAGQAHAVPVQRLEHAGREDELGTDVGVEVRVFVLTHVGGERLVELGHRLPERHRHVVEGELLGGGGDDRDRAGVLEPDGVDDELGSGLVARPGLVVREVQVRAAHPACDEAVPELLLCPCCIRRLRQSTRRRA